MVQDLDDPDRLADERMRMDIYMPTYATPEDALYHSPYSTYSHMQ